MPSPTGDVVLGSDDLLGDVVGVIMAFHFDQGRLVTAGVFTLTLMELCRCDVGPGLSVFRPK